MNKFDLAIIVATFLGVAAFGRAVPGESLGFATLTSFAVDTPVAVDATHKIFATPTTSGYLIAWLGGGDLRLTRTDFNGQRLVPDDVLDGHIPGTQFRKTPFGSAAMFRTPQGEKVFEFDHSGALLDTVTPDWACTNSNCAIGLNVGNSNLTFSNDQYAIAYGSTYQSSGHQGMFFDVYERDGDRICADCLPTISHPPHYAVAQSNGSTVLAGGSHDLGYNHWRFRGYLRAPNGSLTSFSGYSILWPENLQSYDSVKSRDAVPLADGFLVPIAHRPDAGGFVTDLEYLETVKSDVGTVRVNNDGTVEPTNFVTNSPDTTEIPGFLEPFDGGYLLTWVEHAYEPLPCCPGAFHIIPSHHAAKLDLGGNLVSMSEIESLPTIYGSAYQSPLRGSFVHANGDVGWATFAEDANSFLIVRVSPSLLGDYNGDGKVDAADYVAWRKTDGTQAGYDTWRDNFGEHSPEPSSAILAVLWCGCVFLNRGQR